MPEIIGAITPSARALLDALREARTSRQVSATSLSLRMGYSHGVVSHWETGRRIPTPDDVAAFLRALGVYGNERDAILRLAEAAAVSTGADPRDLSTQLVDTITECRAAVDGLRRAALIIEKSLQRIAMIADDREKTDGTRVG
jgi:transcriptional regulator with XRE-family HTH domain